MAADQQKRAVVVAVIMTMTTEAMANGDEWQWMVQQQLDGNDGDGRCVRG